MRERGLTGFKDAQQEARDSNGSVVLGAAQTHGDGAPGQHEEGDPATGAQALEKVVGGDLKQGVSNEEDHEGNGVLVGRHARVGQEVVAGVMVEDLGIANVGAVEVAEQVNGRRQGNNAQVLATNKLLLLYAVNVEVEIIGRRRRRRRAVARDGLGIVILFRHD